MNSEQFLEHILEKLRQRIASLDLSIAQGEKDVEEMNDYYWENYTEMDQYGYENFDNQQALFGQVQSNQEKQKLRHRFRKMLDSPYFGRVDFIYDGEEEPESFYIGIGNFSEETGRTPLIYDWRAPVSSLFYDFDKGSASYTAPAGRLEGEITAKWQYKIRRGKLVYAFESDIKIDDEVLRQELGTNGDVKLKNIVRTIQKEQNAIIRNTADKILVIQGVAGSGKTSVALHRIAYLLYHDREQLKSSNILILSPNSVFSDYISHILPELGEENIQEMSFDLFAYHELKDTTADCEDRYDQIEEMLAGRRDGERLRAKQTEDFVVMLHEFVLMQEYELVDLKDLNFQGLHKTAEELSRLFYDKFPDIPLLSRMEAVYEYCLDEYETLRGKDLGEEDRDTLREKFYKMYRDRDLYVLYSQFLERYGFSPLPRVPYEKRKLAYEDVYPVLYLKYLLFSRGNQKNIKHLVVDEMQDYSYLQYRILQLMFQCRMTILGDRAQTIDEVRQDVLSFLPGIYGKNIRKIFMRKSYRSTVEIADYANRIAADEEMEIFQRHGSPVEEKSFGAWEEAMEAVLLHYLEKQERYETAAVITLTEREAERAFVWLSSRLKDKKADGARLTLLDKNSSRFCRGLTVTTFYLAKGIEFDQVFALRKENSPGALERQADYISATRAMHELHVYRYTQENP
ncbi:MAG TPA: AAA family ATPase [Candidatus Limivivens intestinipullorum]|uniref:AAA family ATPase n=1 Tax=Candidatus Limivivens intestinipullorum TaxID=2840858 RepID=A0A9D1EQJ6_9FIRM|nr:AAA family ATPase [Candidatus Limivivens intestinipullorum]